MELFKMHICDQCPPPNNSLNGMTYKAWAGEGAPMVKFLPDVSKATDLTPDTTQPCSCQGMTEK